MKSFVLTVCACYASCLALSLEHKVTLKNDDIEVGLAQSSSAILSLLWDHRNIKFFDNEFSGPQFVLYNAEGQGYSPAMKKVPESQQGGDSALYRGKDGPLDFSLSYVIHEEVLSIIASIKNTSDKVYKTDRLSLALGLDTYMATYPSWDTKHFPSFLRAEKTHFWGYAMSPTGSIVGIMFPDAIPAWSLRYNNGGHRINGIVFDLMACKPLPSRSTEISRLAPQELKTWTIKLMNIKDIGLVSEIASKQTDANFITADRYTGAPREKTSLTLHGEPAQSIVITTPKGGEIQLSGDVHHQE